MGYELLNKVRAGSLGGMRPKFTYDYFVKMKEGCKTREEYSKKIPGWVKHIAVINGWWEELILDMVKTKKMPGEWNMDNALEEVKKYKTISQLQKDKSGLFKFLLKNNMLKVVFPKTVNELKIEKYNNKEECRKEALKYSTKSEFSLKSNPYHRSSIKNGWIDEICSHMIKIKIIRKSKWTPELLKEKSSECRNRSEFEKKYSGGYKMAKKLNLLDELFLIIDKPKHIFLKEFSDSDRRKIMWTIDLVKEKSLECRTKSEFQEKYSGGYKVAKKYGMLNELFPVESKPIIKSKWTYGLIKEKANECRNRSEFRKKYKGAFTTAEKLGYINEFFPK